LYDVRQARRAGASFDTRSVIIGPQRCSNDQWLKTIKNTATNNVYSMSKKAGPLRLM